MASKPVARSKFWIDVKFKRVLTPYQRNRYLQQSTLAVNSSKLCMEINAIIEPAISRPVSK